MTAGRKIISENKHWGTPENYVKAVKKVFGGNIKLDPCSNKHSIVDAEIEYCLPHMDGLRASWDFESIYVNPPYGADKERGTRIKDWLKKCAEAKERHGAEVLALVPVATNTMHWKQHIFDRATGVCFLYDTRLKFLENGVPGQKGAPMSCAMIYWGKKYSRFFDVFIEFGAVLDLRPLQTAKSNRPVSQPSFFHESKKSVA